MSGILIGSGYCLFVAWRTKGKGKKRKKRLVITGILK